MLEYLIRQTDDEEFSLHHRDWKDVLRPTSVASEVVHESGGGFRLEVEGCEVSFSPEPPGLLISFAGRGVSPEVAGRIVREILARVESFTNQKGKVIALQ